MSIVKLNNKQLAEKYFYEHPKQARKQVCLICYPNFKDDCEESADVKLLTSSSNGYQWAKQHLDAKHKGYDSIGISSQCLLISKEAELTFRWIEWIVQDNHPLNFCQKELTRKNSNLETICTKTLKKRMDLLVRLLEDDLSKSLPPTFGISFDGWSDMGVHYLAVFAVGSNLPEDKPVLLGFSPFEQEGDLSAEQHHIFISTLLGYFQRDESSVIYLVGDNCSTNIKLCHLMKKPLIGCSSHKLNLAVRRWMGMDGREKNRKDPRTMDQIRRSELVDKLSKLMSRLKNIKGKAKLAEFTNFTALKPNETRWNGYFRMVKRYFEFKDALHEIIYGGGEIGKAVAALIPTSLEDLELEEVNTALGIFQEVSLELQKMDGATDLSMVRYMFDRLIQD